MRVDFAVYSDAGPRRTNEDAALGAQISATSWLLAVADGVGGHFGGSQASKLATDLLPQLVDTNPQNLSSAFKEIHRRIVEQQEGDSSLRGMATTLTAAYLADWTLFAAHCGDTRCVVQRGDGIKKLTVAHTEAQRLLDAGKISKEQFFEYPRRNILDSALGAQNPPRIDEVVFALQQGDKILLTSDGVHEKIKLREMLSILLHCSSAEGAVEAIRREVVRKEPEDNFSIVCALVS